VAASAGLPWLGLPVERCRSIGFYAEDEQDELHRRLRGIIELTGAPVSMLCDMHWRSVVADQAELVDVDDRGAIRPTLYFRRVERAALDLGARLLILDAVTNLYGGDEIRRRQVNAFIGMLRQLAIKIDGSVLLLGHPSAAGISTGSGLSGSTHWHNAVRSRLYLARTTGDDADPDERTLTRLKANYAGAGDVLRLRWQRGGFVALDEPSGIDRAAFASKADRVFRALLSATYAEGTWTSPNPASRNYGPSVFARLPDREGLGKPAFAAAMHRLTKAGQIRVETYGRPSDPHSRLAVA
jgi:RecA-family ATPase